jgi:hypothetical protein
VAGKAASELADSSKKSLKLAANELQTQFKVRACALCGVCVCVCVPCGFTGSVYFTDPTESVRQHASAQCAGGPATTKGPPKGMDRWPHDGTSKKSNAEC